MEFDKVVEKRKTIRSFKDKKIDEKLIEKILKNAVLSPSAGNLQAWEFIVLRDEKRIEKLAELCFGQDWIKEAQVAVVVCANQKRSGKEYGKRGEDFYSLIDASLATMTLLLSATNEELGCGIVGKFEDRKLSEFLELPSGIKPVMVIPIGYAGEEGSERDRMPLNKVLHEEKW